MFNPLICFVERVLTITVFFAFVVKLPFDVLLGKNTGMHIVLLSFDMGGTYCTKDITKGDGPVLQIRWAKCHLSPLPSYKSRK